MLGERGRYDVVRRSKHAVDVAEDELVVGISVDNVVAELLEEDRRVGSEALGRGRHHGELLVLHEYELGGVLGQGAALCNDEGDRITDEPHLVPRQRLVHRGSVPFDLEVEVERLRERLEVRRREDSNDARKRPRPLNIDRRDACVGHEAAGESRVHHARQRDVVDVSSAADEDPAVLDTLHSAADELADRGARHEAPPALSFSAADWTPSTMLW